MEMFNLWCLDPTSGYLAMICCTHHNYVFVGDVLQCVILTDTDTSKAKINIFKHFKIEELHTINYKLFVAAQLLSNACLVCQNIALKYCETERVCGLVL